MRGRTRLRPGGSWATAGGAAVLVLLTATGAHAEGRGDVRVVKTVVNGGGNVTVGTSKTVTFPSDSGGLRASLRAAAVRGQGS